MESKWVPVKNQGQCGSCWAFSTIGAVEGFTQLSTGNLISLSEHQIVSCDNTTINQGCNGGLVEEAFEYIIENRGVSSESSYPYLAVNGTCNSTTEAIHAAFISGYEKIPINSEKALLKAIANQPAVSVALDASFFFAYESGVFSGCESPVTYDDLNHAVTAVGYGETSDGLQYWLLNDSWGADWGEDGYIRLLRNVTAKEGMCGIALDSTYPIV